MEEKIRSTLINIITGDAFGSVLEGQSRGHIKSILKKGNIPSGFIEPDKSVIKNRKWRKPGLYTSISQFMLITALTIGRKGFNRRKFLETVRNSSDLEDSEYGIFRHPGQMEKGFIERGEGADTASSNRVIPSSRIISSSTPLVFTPKGEFPELSDIVSFSTMFTNDPVTIAGVLIYTTLTCRFLCSEDVTKDIKQESANIIRQVRNHADDNSSLLFEQGLNPLNIIKDIDRYHHIMESIIGIDENDTAEEIICKELNKTLKTPVKKASIDHPLLLLPYSLHLTARSTNPPTAAIEASMEGGASSSLGAITGALSALIHGKSAVNDILLKNIENRKRILKIIDEITDKNIKKGLIDEFLESEASLTQNEILEYRSRVKNLKQKEKKSLTRKEKEKRLTDHVVESWTKTDKAKWKKQKKKIEKQTHKKI
jgi:ADP-ribosylglycohydrolase